jgi:hypothetical protein
MVAATAVDVAIIDDIPAGNLQAVLGTIYGKAKYAADGVGSAIYKAEQAQAKADTLEGQIGYAASGVGTIDYHLRLIAASVGYTGYPASL